MTEIVWKGYGGTPSRYCSMESISGNTPERLGFCMPAEWDPHEAIYLAWPHDPATFPGRVDAAESAYVEIIRAIHDCEHVELFVLPGSLARVENILRKAGISMSCVTFHPVEYADVWFRDYGPIFIRSEITGEIAMTHWKFNAWGEKYGELISDTGIPAVINSQLGLKRFVPGIVLEGGSIDVNGKGTLLTTSQCLLNKNRNPHLSRKEIERYLGDYLGANHIIWLGEGIAGDDTDGHIDDIARFCNPTTVLAVVEDDPADENYMPLMENYEILLSSTDQDGNRLEVIKLPTPGFFGDSHGRLPASYANFYIGNHTVLVPVFGHANDSRALGIIGECFPGRTVRGIYAGDLVHGLGTIHCMSQQKPR